MANESQTIPDLPVALVEPLLLTAGETARLLGVSRASFYSFLAAGRIGPTETRLGSGRHAKPLFSLAEIRLWLSAKKPDGSLPGRQEWLNMQSQRGE